MSDSAREELLKLSQRLLDVIAAGDWQAYAQLCDPTLSCFEPEAGTHLVEGMPFHKYYFDLPPSKSPRQNTLASPHVRLLGDVAIVSYVRLVQKLDATGAPQTAEISETRVWQRQSGVWKHVHFHRST